MASHMVTDAIKGAMQTPIGYANRAREVVTGAIKGSMRNPIGFASPGQPILFNLNGLIS